MSKICLVCNKTKIYNTMRYCDECIPIVHKDLQRIAEKLVKKYRFEEITFSIDKMSNPSNCDCNDNICTDECRRKRCKNKTYNYDVTCMYNCCLNKFERGEENYHECIMHRNKPNNKDHWIGIGVDPNY